MKSWQIETLHRQIISVLWLNRVNEKQTYSYQALQECLGIEVSKNYIKQTSNVFQVALEAFEKGYVEDILVQVDVL